MDAHESLFQQTINNRRLTTVGAGLGIADCVLAVDISGPLSDFLVSRELTCRASSLALYRHVLVSFEAWIDLHPEPFHPDTIAGYLTSLRKRGLSDQTVRGHYRVLKTCCRWLLEHEHIDRDPFAGRGRVPVPPLRRRRQATYTDLEIARLLTCTAAVNWKRDRVTDRQQWQPGGPLEREAIQARALVLILCDTGMRAGEVCRLRCGDLRRPELVIEGKGGHMDVVFLCPQVRRLLEEVTADRPDADPLFRDWTGKGCSVRALRSIIERLADRAGVQLPPRPLHAFRHLACRAWMKAGLSSLVIQQLMRHANISTTMLYCQVDADELARLHDAASPVEMLLELAGLSVIEAY